MHISFEEDVSIEELEEALLSISRFLKDMGVSRLSCFHMDGLAWQGQKRLNLECRDEGTPVLIDISRRKDVGADSPGSWQAAVVTASMLSDEDSPHQFDR